MGLKLGKGSNRKRRLEEYQLEGKSKERKNFEILPSKHPVLFVGHLSKNSIMVIEKPWIEVVKSLDTQPVDRHIFGTWMRKGVVLSEEDGLFFFVGWRSRKG